MNQRHSGIFTGPRVTTKRDSSSGTPAQKHRSKCWLPQSSRNNNDACLPCIHELHGQMQSRSRSSMSNLVDFFILFFFWSQSIFIWLRTSWSFSVVSQLWSWWLQASLYYTKALINYIGQLCYRTMASVFSKPGYLNTGMLNFHL